MPPPYDKWLASVLCNDCLKPSTRRLHFAYIQCAHCNSFNTSVSTRFNEEQVKASGLVVDMTEEEKKTVVMATGTAMMMGEEEEGNEGNVGRSVAGAARGPGAATSDAAVIDVLAGRGDEDGDEEDEDEEDDDYVGFTEMEHGYMMRHEDDDDDGEFEEDADDSEDDDGDSIDNNRTSARQQRRLNRMHEVVEQLEHAMMFGQLPAGYEVLLETLRRNLDARPRTTASSGMTDNSGAATAPASVLAPAAPAPATPAAAATIAPAVATDAPASGPSTSASHSDHTDDADDANGDQNRKDEDRGDESIIN